MIQIDDAGSGSLIGGTGIGILNTQTSQYYFDIIPLEYYQTNLFQKKSYQDYVIKIVMQGFEKLQVSKNHNIEVCQGYMFDRLREWLDNNNYTWENTRIKGKLQHLVEESFNQYVFKLGLPEAFIKHAKYAFGFHRLLKWVFADIDNRKKLCKTQWKSWQKWGGVEKSVYKNSLLYPDYCLKCGEKMQRNVEVITIEYMTNKPATINLHKKCYNGELNSIPPTFLRNIKTLVKINSKNKAEINPGQELFLENTASKINLVNLKGEVIGCLTNRLVNNLSFWLDYGFVWNCVVQDISDNKILVFFTINKSAPVHKNLIINE